MKWSPLAFFASLTGSLTGPIVAQSFESPVELTEIFSSQSGIEVADFTGDGILDFIAIDTATSGLRVFEGTADGEFRPNSTIDCGLASFGTSLAAISGAPGAPAQAVLLNRSQQPTSLRLVRSNGPLAPPTISTIDSGFDSSSGLGVTDLDGDGDEDILVWRSFRGLFAYFNNGAGFSPVSTPILLTNNIQEFQFVDLNHDGIKDIVFLGFTFEWRAILSQGAGLFSAPVSFLPATVVDPQRVTFGDFNGDGLADLAVQEDQQAGVDFPVKVFPAVGPLAFGPGVTANLTSPRQDNLRAVDLDLDGLDDLLYSARFAGSIGPTVACAFSTGGLAFGPSIQLIASPQPPSSISPNLRFADITGDSRLEAITVGSTQDWRLREQAGTGSSMVFDAGTSIARQTEGVGLPVPTDLDGDGDLDFVTISRGTRKLMAYENLGGFCFARGEILGGSNTEVDVRGAADFNGDGRDDLLIRVDNSSRLAIRPGLGGGQFGPREFVGDGLDRLRETFISDIDGDGDLDVVALGKEFLGNRTRVSLFQNTGGGIFVGSRPIGFDRGADEVVVDDLDGDGDLDFLELGPPGAFFRAGRGDGTFESPLTVQTTAVPVQSATSIDLDGDGDRDVMAVGMAGDWMVSMSSGGGQFAPFAAFTGLPPTLSVTRLIAGQFDGVNGEDVVYSGVLGDEVVAQLARSNGVSGFLFPEDITGRNVGPGRLGKGDLDGDGDLDLWTEGRDRLFVMENRAVAETGVGVEACFSGALNSSGRAASITAYGSLRVQSADLRLVAFKLPVQSFGFVVGSLTPAPPAAVANSDGLLCLGGSIGRYISPGQILNSGSAGVFQFDLDPTSLRNAQGTVPALPGQQWYFQAWFRDVNSQGQATSNFTNATVLRFTN